MGSWAPKKVTIAVDEDTTAESVLEGVALTGYFIRAEYNTLDSGEDYPTSMTLHRVLEDDTEGPDLLGGNGTISSIAQDISPASPVLLARDKLVLNVTVGAWEGETGQVDLYFDADFEERFPG